jgi:hypothetical protein
MRCFGTELVILALPSDLARHTFPLERLHDLVEHMSQLGFNTLHLRLVDDFSFAIETKKSSGHCLGDETGRSCVHIQWTS